MGFVKFKIGSGVGGVASVAQPFSSAFSVSGSPILPFDVSSNGETKVAVSLRLYVSYDDLRRQAAFQYALCDVNNLVIYEGQLLINGTTYLNWGTSGDFNQEAYVIVASALNLTLI